MKVLVAAVCLSALLAGTAVAADAPANPLISSSQAFYAQLKDVVLRSADKMPEADYSFRPVPEVRTFGGILAHIADAQFMMCGMASGSRPAMKGFEKTATTKADIIAALKDGFAFCDGVYAKMTDADAATTVPMFGQQRTKLSVLDFNIAHGYEHYGNLVTYMRIKGIVPPSSERRPPSGR
jgi:uncharacterized damage-inducible protein DinB